MKLQQRIFLLTQLGGYILSGDEAWQQVKERAGRENRWFIPEFVAVAISNIAHSFLQKDILEKWVSSYGLKTTSSIPEPKPLTIGLVMAGNIPLVGFHDLLCIFISGHKALVKLSSKDQLLVKHLTGKLEEWTNGTPEAAEMKASIEFSEMLKGCDAY
ncbi:MAG: acyl-CoA reductase, partial [Bacteroidia bacterium]|nr:acyl-CoA reductase [Bacteroidia bacterium]